MYCDTINCDYYLRAIFQNIMFRYGSEIFGWSFCVQTQRQWYRTTSSYTGIIFCLNLLLTIYRYIYYVCFYWKSSKNRTNQFQFQTCVYHDYMNGFNFEIQWIYITSVSKYINVGYVPPRFYVVWNLFDMVTNLAMPLNWILFKVHTMCTCTYIPAESNKMRRAFACTIFRNKAIK